MTAGAAKKTRATVLAERPEGQVVPRSGVPTASQSTVVTIDEQDALDLFARLGPEDGQTARATRQVSDQSAVGISVAPTPVSINDRLNGAIGCKTANVALTLLAQVVQLEHDDIRALSETQINKAFLDATAMLAELQPTNATEAMLAAQMIGTQRAAMRFLKRALLTGQTFEGVDANVLRATRLMRLFTEQAETMAKLKGKSGQQRVIVEHVNVGAGGQAVVGIVAPGEPGEPQGTGR